MTTDDPAAERTTDGDSNEADGTGQHSTDDTDSDDTPLPEPVVDEAERLTRLARNTADDEAAAYRAQRGETLDEHDYTARVRDEDDTLVLYPDAWLDGETVRLERVEDTDRAVEVSLSGPTGEDAWPEIEAHNADLVAAVEADHGAVHAANARAFADFMGNHYLARIESATADQVTEFIEEYYPRNAWASAAQREVVDSSLEYVFAAADTGCPTGSAESEN
jgi:hypothetical protein